MLSEATAVTLFRMAALWALVLIIVATLDWVGHLE